MRNEIVTFVCVASLIVIACGRAEREGARTESAITATTPAANETFAFTESDLDAYARGMAKEIELVKAAQVRAGTATDANERGAAIQAQWEDQTIPEAARLAGIDAERYRRTRQVVHEVFKTLDFQGKIDGPLSIDLSRVDDATRAKLTRDPFTDLPASSAAALRARMNRLVPLWIEYVTLTTVAG